MTLKVTLPRDMDVFYKVACCLHDSAKAILAEAGLKVPDKGFPTHKGPDYECEDCTSLWAWMDSTVNLNPGFPGEDSCSEPLSRTFFVELAYPVCTEGINPCHSDDEGCTPDPDSDCGCALIDPRLGDGKCAKGNRPTVTQETQYIWRARYVLEACLAEVAKCCLLDCGQKRCTGTRLVSTEEVTEGGCSFLRFAVEVTW